MDELHRRILRKNRTGLIENIAKPDDVNEKLYERQVFTESMRQDIQVFFCLPNNHISRTLRKILCEKFKAKKRNCW